MRGSGGRRIAGIAAAGCLAVGLAVGAAGAAPAAGTATSAEARAGASPRKVDLRVVAVGIPSCSPRISAVRVTIDNVRSTSAVKVTVKINGGTRIREKVVPPLSGWPRVNGPANTFRLRSPMARTDVIMTWTAASAGSPALSGASRPLLVCS